MTLPTFAELFGREPDVASDAPGRVNLIGEHTDYNGGFVLPAAIPQRTRVQLARRTDKKVRLWSAQYADAPFAEYALGHETRTSGWIDYVQGMTMVLGQQYALRGFDARVESDVPVGSGLSSSAALEIAAGRSIRRAFALDIDDVSLAKAGRRAENELVGAPVGIMDQMASSLADTTAALFLDTRTLEYSRVPIPAGAELVVINSGVAHNHAAGDYVTRRRECSEAARMLRVAELRDVTIAELARIDALPEPLNRRARHVVTENARVIDAVAALRAGRLDLAGLLFNRSHVSMRDDFAISVPEVDALVDAAAQVQGVYGARLTGGGFGGSIVVLVEHGRAVAVAVETIGRFEKSGYSGARTLVPA